MSTDRDIADQPLDDVDRTILDTVAEVFRAADPVPAGLTEDIKFALTVQAMHAEVAELQRVGAESALARSEYTHTQTLTFSAEAISVMVTMSPIDADEVRIDGWVTGHDSPVRVEVRAETRTHHRRGRRRWPVHHRPRTPWVRALRVPARGGRATRHHADRRDLRTGSAPIFMTRSPASSRKQSSPTPRALRRARSGSCGVPRATWTGAHDDGAAHVSACAGARHLALSLSSGAIGTAPSPPSMTRTAPRRHGASPVRILVTVQRAGLHGTSRGAGRQRADCSGIDIGSREVAPRARCVINLNLGLAFQFLGRYTDSDTRLRRAHQEAVALGFPELAAAAVHNRGRLQLLLGNLPRALSLMEQARAIGGDLLPPAAVLDRARVLSEAGLIDQAMETLEEGEQAARAGGIAHDVAEADLERARLALLRRDTWTPAVRGPCRAPVRPRVAAGLGGSRLTAARQAEQLAARPGPTAATPSALATVPAHAAPSAPRPRLPPRRITRREGRRGPPCAGSTRGSPRGLLPPPPSSAPWPWPSCTRPRCAPTSCAATTARRAPVRGGAGAPHVDRLPKQRTAHQSAARRHLDLAIASGSPAISTRPSLAGDVAAPVPRLAAAQTPDIQLARLRRPTSLSTATPRRLRRLRASTRWWRLTFEAAARQAERAVALRRPREARVKEEEGRGAPGRRSLRVGSLLEQARPGLLSLFIDRERLWAGARWSPRAGRLDPGR